MDEYGYRRPHPWAYGRRPSGRRGMYVDEPEMGGWPFHYPGDNLDNYSFDGRETWVASEEDDEDWPQYPRYRRPYSRRRGRYRPRMQYVVDDLNLPPYGPEDVYYSRLPRGTRDDIGVNYGTPPYGDPGTGGSIYHGYRYRHPRGPGYGPPGPPDYYDEYHHHYHDHVHFHEHNHKHHHGHRHKHEHCWPYGPFNMLNFVMSQGFMPGPGLRYATPMGFPLDAAYGYRGAHINMLPQGAYGPPLPYLMRRNGIAR
ncbi:hypothetical protein DTO169E5_8464 [Paecilomyces variotii]|nr:hypothetical protein DTO169E5_8464 [Paecilomyces variotii]KAJ9267844.1 hypothetical protein DTO195F2_178 [Paecilomyces variotii]